MDLIRGSLRVEIDKKSGGIRVLAIPCVRDRLLQTAVAMVLTPLFEAEFEDISFAYRKGRSVKQAVARIELLRNQGYQWVVDANILLMIIFNQFLFPFFRVDIKKLFVG